MIELLLIIPLATVCAAFLSVVIGAVIGVLRGMF